jgi:hypothetical protein
MQQRTAQSVFVLTAVLAALAVSGCVKTGAVTEVQPLTGKVSSYGTAVIWITAASADLEAHVPTMMESFSGQLQQSGLFGEVTTSDGAATDGDLQIKLEITALDEGSGAARAFNVGGEAVISVAVELTDVAEQKVVAKLEVEGNSARTSETSFGGVNTKWFDNLTNRAIVAAGEQVVEYLKEKQ